MAFTKPKRVSPTQKSEVLMKDWLGNHDIMILAECGINRAIEIKKAIQKQILAEGRGILSFVVPKKSVMNYLDINEDYIFRLAEKEQRLGFTGKQ